MNKGGEKRATHKRRGKRTFTASDRKGAKIPVHGGYLHLFLSRVSYTQADTDAEEKNTCLLLLAILTSNTWLAVSRAAEPAHCSWHSGLFWSTFWCARVCQSVN